MSQLSRCKLTRVRKTVEETVWKDELTTICRSEDLTVPPLVGCCRWNLTIKADIVTKLIISNIYIPPASSCWVSIFRTSSYDTGHPYPLISTIRHGTLDRYGRINQRIKLCILNWDSPTRVPPNAEPSSPDVSLDFITSCYGRPCQRLAQTIYQIRLQMKTSSTPGLRNLSQPKAEQIGDRPEQAFPFNRLPKRREDLPYSSTQTASHHIWTT